MYMTDLLTEYDDYDHKCDKINTVKHSLVTHTFSPRIKLNPADASLILTDINRKIILNISLFGQILSTFNKVIDVIEYDPTIDKTYPRLCMIQQKKTELKRIENQISNLEHDISVAWNGGVLMNKRRFKKPLCDLVDSSRTKRLKFIIEREKIKPDLINSSILIEELIKDYQDEQSEYEKQKTRYNNPLYQNSIDSSVKYISSSRDSDHHWHYINYMINIVISFKFISRRYTDLKNEDINQIKPHVINQYKEDYVCLINSMNRFVSTINNSGGLKIDCDTKHINETMIRIKALHNDLKLIVNTIEDDHKWLINTYNYDTPTTDVSEESNTLDTSDVSEESNTLVASDVLDHVGHLGFI